MQPLPESQLAYIITAQAYDISEDIGLRARAHYQLRSRLFSTDMTVNQGRSVEHPRDNIVHLEAMFETRDGSAKVVGVMRGSVSLSHTEGHC